MIIDDILGLFRVNINIDVKKEDGIIVLGAIFLGIAVLVGAVEVSINSATGIGMGLGIVGVLVLSIGVAFKASKRRGRW